MESRTINRPPPRPKGSVAGRVGLRRSEEEYWSEAGVYDFDNKADIKYSKNDTEKKTDWQMVWSIVYLISELYFVNT